MARILTRTILTDNVKVLAYDNTIKDTTELVLNTDTHFTNEKAALKYMQKNFGSDDFEILKVLDIEVIATHYELEQEIFLKYARKVEVEEVEVKDDDTEREG